MLLIGSRALIRLLGQEVVGRQPRDFDLIGSFSELSQLTNKLRKETKLNSIPLSPNKTVLKCEDGRIFEFEIAWEGSSGANLLNHIETLFGQCTMVADLTAFIPTLDQLYTLKMSHRYLKNSPHFKKTRDDIMLMRQHGAKIFDQEWLKQREKETYVYKHPKLNVMKGDFFKGDGVEYVYDHDTIHVAMAHLPQPAIKFELIEMLKLPKVPAYTLYMKDDAPVMCDRAKFFNVDEIVRLYGVLEESYVLALERSQIPFRGKVAPHRSFIMALQKVCTSITSGWFREFAWENYDKIESMYDSNYVDRFWHAVDNGIVKRLTVEPINDVDALFKEIDVQTH